MDLLGDFEFLFLELFQVLVLHQKQIAVAVIAAQEAVEVRAPVAELVFDGVAQIILDTVGLVLHQLVHVVNDDDAGHGAAVFVFDADVVVIRHIHPVGDAHEDAAAALRFLVGVDETAVQLVLAPADFQQSRIAGLALENPGAVELRDKLGNARVQARAGLTAHLEKLFVAPDDTGILQLEDGDGQRKIDERAALGTLRLVNA